VTSGEFDDEVLGIEVDAWAAGRALGALDIGKRLGCAPITTRRARRRLVRADLLVRWNPYNVRGRARKKTLGMFRDRVLVNDMARLSDDQLIEAIAKGDPERERAARLLLGAGSFDAVGDGFPDAVDEIETRH
jgi:hypothetical protein